MVNLSCIFWTLSFISMVFIGHLLVNFINTVITDKISDLEHQRVSVEERRQILKKLEQDELRAQ